MIFIEIIRWDPFFELNVGNGALLVCGYNLNSDQPVSRQLKSSLLKYMDSPKFNPQQNVDPSWLQNVLPSLPKVEKVDVPEKFENAILYVNAGENMTEINENTDWKPELDEVKLAKETTYQLTADGVWKDESGTAWHGIQMQLLINCPDGILGFLYVYFRDWNAKGRTGILDFEGRKMKLDKHEGDGQWVKFLVMREDSNDGKLLFKTNAQSGGNLLITKVVLVSE